MFPETIQRFIDDTTSQAQQHGVNIVLSPTPHIPYLGSETLLVSGYFCDRPKLELAVATGQPQEDWFPIFVHEACHMQQWIEQSPVWHHVFIQDKEALDWIEVWLNGENNLPEPIEQLIARTRQLELDCECRALQAIERYQLPIDPHIYAQKANAYVYFYNHLLRTRAWYPCGNVAYENPQIWSHAPTTLDIKRTQTPEALAQIFTDHYG